MDVLTINILRVHLPSDGDQLEDIVQLTERPSGSTCTPWRSHMIRPALSFSGLGSTSHFSPCSPSTSTELQRKQRPCLWLCSILYLIALYLSLSLSTPCVTPHS
ncbi:hypothetical protein DPEC_G00283000 [Dallia pectoralis]|uniref:Uncharacterized protein n=1 Tax=Dallia pectoralis TaxID=75939 RepID=A0ACC2FJ39_DALPE|nr:hypothetical protein DPEC_G00283000 [Dallia pectoralis]